MYYISDYKKRAINSIIPYLIEFPDIVKIIEYSASRYQAIEDVLWQIANNFKVDDARGIFLDALAHNEVVDIIYTDVADDAFTFGTDKPLYQAYGTGHYYSQTSYISGIRKDISEDKMIRAIKAKIIQNNTKGAVEDLIESLKLYYNATNIRLFESNPLNLSIMLSGPSLEISSSGNYETIKKMLPACVKLNNIYVDSYAFDIFEYSENSSYGDCRYPVRVGESTDIYNYISLSVNLDSEFKEHVITNHEYFEDNMFSCIVGEITNIQDGATLFSSNDIENNQNFSLIISQDLEMGKNYIALKYNENIYKSDIEAKLDTRYTFILSNSNNNLNLWVLNGVQVYGNNLNQDTSFINNTIMNITPQINISNFSNVIAPIYINCLNEIDGPSNFGDFTYYALIFGKNSELTEYYVTCYGEKQILFNCLSNKNHLKINTENPLVSNIMVQQGYYNYKSNHSNGKYMYLDGKSGIDYFLSYENTDCQIDNANISFEVCCPMEISNNPILCGFLNYNDTSVIYINNENSLCVEFVEYFAGEILLEQKRVYKTEPNTIVPDEYCKFQIEIKDSKLYIYKNFHLILEENLYSYPVNLPTKLKVGYNSDSYFKGFIKNLFIDINGKNEEEIYNRNIIIPFTNSLKDKDKKVEYVNKGARLLTSPQLISDTKMVDLYGNTLLGKR